RNGAPCSVRCEVRFASKQDPRDHQREASAASDPNRIPSALDHHHSYGQSAPNDRYQRRQLKRFASFRETNEAKLARCEINRLPALANLRGALSEHATQISCIASKEQWIGRRFVIGPIGCLIARCPRSSRVGETVVQQQTRKGQQ